MCIAVGERILNELARRFPLAATTCESRGVDRRLSLRFELQSGSVNSLMTFADGSELTGTLVDFSVHGATIVADRLPEIGQAVHLRLLVGDEERVDAVGQVRNQGPSGQGCRFGVRFVDVEDEQHPGEPRPARVPEPSIGRGVE